MRAGEKEDADVKEGDKVMLIAVPECYKEDLYKTGTIVRMNDHTEYGRNVDVLLDEDKDKPLEFLKTDKLTVCFDHQLRVIDK